MIVEEKHSIKMSGLDSIWEAGYEKAEAGDMDGNE